MVVLAGWLLVQYIGNVVLSQSVAQGLKGGWKCKISPMFQSCNLEAAFLTSTSGMS